MNHRGEHESGGDPGPDPEVAAAAIRDAIDAIGAGDPELVARLIELLARLERGDAGDG